MLLQDVAETSAAVADTARRLAKIELLATCLQRAEPADVPVVVAYLSGELRQRRTGLGYAALRELPLAATEATLTVGDVDATFATMAALSGQGSATARRQQFTDLMARATSSEQRLIAGLVGGELHQGALEGVLTEAVASAASLPSADIRQATMVAGALAPVAQAVLTKGRDGLARFQLVVGTPVRPMLAQSAPSVSDALARIGPAALEWKLDGVRVQIHRIDDEIWVFTRTLDDVTDRVPELVDIARTLPVRSVVLDGEAIGLNEDGSPHPFQRTASRIGRKLDVSQARADIPLSLFLFDCLHINGRDLVGLPQQDRVAALTAVAPDTYRVRRLVGADEEHAQRFFAEAVATGHEGVIVKALDAPYEAGRRGAGWIKVKPRHTLDLVILAAEWGHGRRQGMLSNLHLGARDPDGRYGDPEGFVMLGKTFKGLTDAMLNWQTNALLALADGPTEEWMVHVRPELVVEVAFDGVQSSPRYPAGMALRFARVLHHRPDKPATQADTIDAVHALHHTPAP